MFAFVIFVLLYKHLVCFQEGDGQWLSLDSEIIMHNGVVAGTRYPTGHSILIDARFELPNGKYYIARSRYISIYFYDDPKVNTAKYQL